MLEELDRTNLIIDEFLLQAKKKIIDLQLNDLNQIIKGLYPLLKADAIMEYKTIVLELGSIPEIFMNKSEIRQLIINLVHNRLGAKNIYLVAGRRINFGSNRPGKKNCSRGIG
jgi:nitrogen-specific signal transduction histidine kinase